MLHIEFVVTNAYSLRFECKKDTDCALRSPLFFLLACSICFCLKFSFVCLLVKGLKLVALHFIRLQ